MKNKPSLTDNFNLQKHIIENFEDIDSKLSDISNGNLVDVKNFTGANDFEKVQNGINYGITNQKTLVFTNMYDITGFGSLKINKNVIDRKSFYMVGLGGGITKNDIGNIFTSDTADTSDVFINDMKFNGTSGNETFLLDGDKIIRINVNNCTLDGCKMITSPTRWVQSCRFKGNTITGFSGWAYDYNKCYDLTIDGDIIEEGANGIRSGKSNQPDNNTLRIINCVIEGLSGKAIELGSCFGVTISGNYMELNTGGYIDLAGLTAGYHNGLVISGNTCQQSAQQKTDRVPFIKIKDIGNFGMLSSGNVSTGVLYEYSGNAGGSTGCLVSIGDISYLSVAESDAVNVTNSAFQNRVIRITRFDQLPFNKTSLLKSTQITTGTISAGATTDVTLPCTFDPTKGVVDLDIGASGGTTFEIVKYMKTTTNVKVTIKNIDTAGQYFVCTANCLMPS